MPSEITDAMNAMSAFKGLLKGFDNSKWAKFLRKYTSMNENDFKEYLKSEGINYDFDSNSETTEFTDTTGQKAVKNPTGGKKALTSDQKLEAFNLMKGNIKEFLANNPGLSLEQVRGLFDSAVMSADNSWGFGKNEFRFEGRGANSRHKLFNAEAVVMDEGQIKGVFTEASTIADNGRSVGAGIYDYSVGYHHVTRKTNEGAKTVLYTTVGETPEKYTDPETGEIGWYHFTKDDGTVVAIDRWDKGTYKALLISGVPNRTAIVSHAGYEYQQNGKWCNGSLGCMTTYYANDYVNYINLFNFGDTGKFIVVK